MQLDDINLTQRIFSLCYYTCSHNITKKRYFSLFIMLLLIKFC
jgi:hypothetical protein